ncbi:MAG TPA: hypothetical protein VMF30_19765 [Pirellulales bacterium]|nr:hypothetical protein [Pirellulales bacterium]
MNARPAENSPPTGDSAAGGASGDRSLVDRLAAALLYEGYILYPYRASAVKNQQRFNFGGLYPPAYVQAQSGADAARMQIEILVVVGPQTTLTLRVRFLHLVARQISQRVGRRDSPSDLSRVGDVGTAAPPDFDPVDAVEVGGRKYVTWQEAVEREIPLSVVGVEQVADRPLRHAFSFPASCTVEPLVDERGAVVAAITRRQAEIRGAIEIAAVALGDGVYRLHVCVENLAPAAIVNREEALPATLLSTHAIFSVAGGEFVSLLEPPDELRAPAADCQNIGAWPVLVGTAGERHTMLASPIILYDYPQIAPESAGDLFDGTEIDEILSLRIMLLTDEEKREMSAVDDRARKILERTEALPEEQFWKMHGVVRGMRPAEETRP